MRASGICFTYSMIGGKKVLYFSQAINSPCVGTTGNGINLNKIWKIQFQDSFCFVANPHISHVIKYENNNIYLQQHIWALVLEAVWTSASRALSWNGAHFER